jgi:dTDP-4-dehydrorhamnose 3,5-epimerase
MAHAILTEAGSPATPLGVELRPLTTHQDERGTFTEIFRNEWDTGIEPVQWNCVRSAAGVLRGVHAHATHADYLVIVHGRASIGLRDLRPGSPTAGMASLVEVVGDRLTAITIPPGVAHGFYFHEPSLHIYAVSEYWNPGDELGCHWADPALGIPWPMTTAQLSPRDAALPPLSVLVRDLAI